MLASVPGVLGLVGASGVRAQTVNPPFQMTWDVPAECSPQDRTKGQLVKLLGKDPDQMASGPIAVHAAIARAGGEAWRIELAITQHGERRLRRLVASSCEELGDAVALLVALAIDPDVQARLGVAPPDGPLAAPSSVPPVATPLPAPTAAQPPSPVPAATTAQATMPYAPAAQRLRWDGFVGAGPFVELGVLPHAGFGISAVGGVDIEQLRLELGARYATAAPSSHRVHFDLRAVALRACWLVPLGSAARLGPCAMTELGRLRADGREGVRQGNADWGSARAGVHIGVRTVRSLDLALQGDVGLPLGRPTFIAYGAQEHRPARIVGSARLLIEAHFP